MKEAEAKRCSPVTIPSWRVSGRASRRKRDTQATERFTTQRRGSTTMAACSPHVPPAPPQVAVIVSRTA